MRKKGAKASICLGALAAALLSSTPTQAQPYDDFETFSADPVALDQEAADIFGRFFQSTFNFGMGIFTGDLGAANAAGAYLGIKFIYYFDEIWAAELGAAWARHSGAYTTNNTLTNNVDISFNTTLVPLSLGFRYGFDREALPRGFSTMNPYVSLNGVMVFRKEKLDSNITPQLSGLNEEAKNFFSVETNSSKAFGFNIGGGVEFDVYRQKLFLGADLRYNQIFWPNKNMRVGSLERGGAYITLLGNMTYSY